MISKIRLRNLTVFEDLEMELSPKINVIIGENGTGKTHLLKAVYALAGHGVKDSRNKTEAEEAISVSVTKRLQRCFMPYEDRLGRIKRHGVSESADLSLFLKDDRKLRVTFNVQSKQVAVESAAVDIADPVYVPTKEVLSFARGFTSLYDRYQLSFDQTYFDVCNLLDLPERRKEALEPKSLWAVEEIEKVCGGKFVFYGGGNVTFKTSDSEYSANAMAEGFRKAGMLSRLLLTGAIHPGKSGPLLWDEPETNLNPRLMGLLVRILLELSRGGQQIIVATHEYVLLKWFDLLTTEALEDEVVYHSLQREKNGAVTVRSTDDYLSISPNPIADTFEELTKQQLRKQLTGEANETH